MREDPPEVEQVVIYQWAADSLRPEGSRHDPTSRAERTSHQYEGEEGKKGILRSGKGRHER